MPPTTRRERRRLDALAEIRARAREVLAESGAEQLTLRGLAADLGMAPTGVHYYYASRDDLVAAVITEAFDSLAAAVAGGTPVTATGWDAWAAAAWAHRGWALGNPELFQLAHSRTATRLKDRPGLLEAKDRAVRALMDPLAAAIASGELRLPDDRPTLRPALRRNLRAWAEAAGVPRDPHLLLALLQAYVLVQGQVLLSVTGSLPRELLEDDSLFAALLDQVRRMLS